MKLKTKTYILFGIFMAMLITLMSVSYLTSKQVSEAAISNKDTNNIRNQMSELRMLTFDYIFYKQERAVEQWQIRYESLGKLLAPEEHVKYHHTEEEHALLEKMYEAHKDLGDIFSQLTQAGISSELKTRLAYNLLIKTQDIVSITSQLSDITNNRIIDAQAKFNYFNIAFLSLLFIVALTIVYIIFQTILKPIEKLHGGTEIIGKGNLDYKVGTKATDEIGQLSRAFDEMTENLQKREQLNKLIFLNTSHELKTPLTPILIQARALRDEDLGKLSSKQKESLEIILRNMNRLNVLIEDILEISRVQTGGIHLDLKKTKIKDIVSEVIRKYQTTAKNKGLNLIEKIPETLIIPCDPKRIEEVFSNLIDNAIKFTLKGKISVEAEKKEGYILFKVKDTGIGIPKKDKSKVFSPFFQVTPSYAIKDHGTGLGLSICRGLVQQHRGKIWFESEEGKGSTFYFTLPLNQEIK